jgi:alpha-methylacyl-CoA racemase
MSPQRLSGYRVVDLSRLLPGPFCTWLLGCQGAEVLKIEDPQGGDPLRHVPPFLPEKDARGGPVAGGGQGALFAMLNRGKKSVALDLRKDGGRRALRALLAGADVLVEGFRPGVMERLGLPPEDLCREFPRLVFARITGWGQTGPWATLPGHDLNFVGAAGLLSLGRRCDGLPVLPGIQAADLNGGSIYAAFAIVSALLERERSGKGALLDLAMAEGALTLVAPALAAMAATGSAPPPGEDMLTGGSPSYGVYRCSDGRFLTFCPLEPAFWEIFRERSGYAGSSPVASEIAAILATRPREAWVELLAEACVAPMFELSEVPEQAQFSARGVIRKGPFTLEIAPPVSGFAEGFSPSLGEHTEAEMRRVGLDVETLRQEGVFGPVPER